jgi:very-short-patch-repair endonuclease
MEFNRPTARQRARQLRRDQTDAEQTLWAPFATDNFVVPSFADSIPSAHSLLTFVVRRES